MRTMWKLAVDVKVGDSVLIVRNGYCRSTMVWKIEPAEMGGFKAVKLHLKEGTTRTVTRTTRVELVLEERRSKPE